MKDKLEQSIDWLGGQQSFATLLLYIKQNREAAISDLYSGNTEQMLRGSGEIKALDELLRLLKAEEVLGRWQEMIK